MYQYLFIILFVLVLNYVIIEPFSGKRKKKCGKKSCNKNTQFNYVRGGWNGGYSYTPKRWRRHFYHYSPYWYNPFSYFYAPCKTGCVPTGNGGWGCLFPGSGYHDCLFASDCYGCNL